MVVLLKEKQDKIFEGFMVRSPNSFEELTCYDDEGPCKDLGISKQTLNSLRPIKKQLKEAETMY